MDALIIKPFWLDKILSGEKTWEIRGMATKKRGTIGLIASGSGMVSGTAELVDAIGPLSLEHTLSHPDALQKHCIPADNLHLITYSKTYAWLLKNVQRFDTPRPYRHPQGAVIWVKNAITD